MPSLFRPRPGVLRLAAALSLGAVALSFAWQVPTAGAASAAPSQANELVRLINGARVSVGKPALLVDRFLAAQAMDGAIPCPDDPSQTIAGRAQDFAATGQMSHQVRLCNAPSFTLSGTTFVSMLETQWGYGSVGEILLVNGGYGNGQFLYTSGNWSTWTYATTGHALTAWRTSSGHWNIIVGGYDRVGCGAWVAADSKIYYACEFSAGGPSPSGLAAAPTTSPFSDPLPAPTVAPPPPAAPTRVPAPPVTQAPVVTKAPAPKPTSPPTAVESATVPATDPPATPSESAVVSIAPTAGKTEISIVKGIQAVASEGAPAVLAAVDGGAAGALLGSSNVGAIPAGLTRESVVGFTVGAVLLVGIWVLIDRIRRRRRQVAR